MKRHAGTFLQTEAGWFVRNDAPAEQVHHLLYILEPPPAAQIVVPPQTIAPLGRRGAVLINELAVIFEVPNASPSAAQPEPTTAVPETEWKVHLTARMVDYIVALAEPELRGQPPGLRRTHREVAHLWDVDVTTVRGTLKEARARFCEKGYLLQYDDPERQQESKTMTEALVRASLKCGVVTFADLLWARISDADGPVKAEEGPRFKAGATR